MRFLLACGAQTHRALSWCDCEQDDEASLRRIYLRLALTRRSMAACSIAEHCATKSILLAVSLHANVWI